MSSHDDEFVEFVRGTSPRLLKAAWFICGDTDDAHDLVQSAYEKVYLRWGQVREGQPLAYAKRCMLNKHLDGARRRGRHQHTTEVPDRGHVQQLPDDTWVLVEALRHLSERERQIVVMRYYVDLPEAEVAEILGISLGTVKSTASRSLAKLRTVMHPHEGVNHHVR